MTKYFPVWKFKKGDVEFVAFATDNTSNNTYDVCIESNNNVVVIGNEATLVDASDLLEALAIPFAVSDFDIDTDI